MILCMMPVQYISDIIHIICMHMYMYMYVCTYVSTYKVGPTKLST